MTNVVHDSTGQVVRRTVRHGAHLVTQVRQADGSWWNLKAEPAR